VNFTFRDFRHLPCLSPHCVGVRVQRDSNDEADAESCLEHRVHEERIRVCDGDLDPEEEYIPQHKQRDGRLPLDQRQNSGG
jgi:hypothetical protein